MGYLLVFCFYPEAILYRPLRAFLAYHKKLCPACPSIESGYCARYRPIWWRVIQSRQMLHRARWARAQIR